MKPKSPVQNGRPDLASLALNHEVDATVVCDEHGRVVRAGHAARRLCDGDPLFRPFAEVFPLNAGTGGPLSLDLVLQGATLRDVDATFDWHGQTFALIVMAGPIVDGGRVVGCAVTLTDISECKRDLAALIASEVKYRRLFEAARDGILILDAATGEVLDVNPYLCELLGLQSSDFLGRRLWDLGPFRDARLNEARFHELQETGYVRYEDLALLTTDGRRAEVEFVSNVYRANGATVIQCNIRDIADRKRADAMIAKQLDELERWQNVTLGREERVQELKHEVNELCLRAGGPERYPQQDAVRTNP